MTCLFFGLNLLILSLAVAQSQSILNYQALEQNFALNLFSEYIKVACWCTLKSSVLVLHLVVEDAVTKYILYFASLLIYQVDFPLNWNILPVPTRKAIRNLIPNFVNFT